MKKQAILLLITILIALSSISQNTADTTTKLPNSTLINVINALETGKVVAQELALTNKKVGYLQERIVAKDSIIAVYIQKDSLCQTTIKAYDSIISNYKLILKNTEESYRLQEKIIRRKSLSKWFTLTFGIAATYILIHK